MEIINVEKVENYVCRLNNDNSVYVMTGCGIVLTSGGIVVDENGNFGDRTNTFVVPLIKPELDFFKNIVSLCEGGCCKEPKLYVNIEQGLVGFSAESV